MKHDHKLIAGVVAIAIAVAILCMCLPNPGLSVEATWTIGVPVWFWFEYTFLVSEDDKKDQIAFSRLKYSQELGSKVWLAVVAVLVLRYH